MSDATRRELLFNRAGVQGMTDQAQTKGRWTAKPTDLTVNDQLPEEASKALTDETTLAGRVTAVRLAMRRNP